MTTKYVVEDGVPIPAIENAGSRKKGSGLRGMISRMDVGQSVFLSGKSRGYASGTVSNSAKETGHKYISRAVEGGYRIWRTA